MYDNISPSSDKSIGTPSTTARSAFDLRNCRVQDEAGHRVGRLRDIVIVAPQGTVSYDVIGFGGVCGIGERQVALPWSSLRLSPRGKCLEIIDAEQPSEEPSVAESEEAKGTIRKITATTRRWRASARDEKPAEDSLVYRLLYRDE